MSAFRPGPVAGDASPLILASGSPRRRELLRGAGIAFVIDVPDVDESPLPGESPEMLVERLARSKARTVAERSPPEARVLAADTLVVLGEEILGKPLDLDDARAMILRLSGRTHRVLTGFALLGPQLEGWRVGVVESRVTFRSVTAAEAAAYVAAGESLDKAGAYAVQGRGGTLVDQIDGSRSNVIGLPLEVILPLLEASGANGPSPEPLR